ncbi:MAG: hypothetical protein HYZ42_13335, partial [Bacteroidetes bacterium]|nr:hypothetical protein [Bacteroidota bacterium]
RLIGPFHSKDPIDNNDLARMKTYIHEQLLPLKDALQKHPTHILIGAAGAFESLLELANEERPIDHIKPFELSRFSHLYDQLINSTKEERMAMNGLVDYRVEMMVAATVLMQVAFEIQQTSELYVSPYSLKEGILFDSIFS